MRNPYEILGVAKTASPDEIKRAYRRLAKQYHPDRNPNDAKLAERFKEVNAAHRLLGDEEMRRRYDRGEVDEAGNERHPHFESWGQGRGGPRPEGASGFRFQFGEGEDFFSDLFGGFDRRAQRGGRARPRGRGQDVSYALRIGFLDAVKGGTQSITLPDGRVLNVKIPPGLAEGQQIRLRGQGQPGQGQAPAGDALIEVTIEPHPFFERKGDDIHLEVPVTLTEAVLGARITVPTIDGAVSLTVPKGASSGTMLRLKGRGIPGRGSQPAGDQYVKVKLVLPDPPDPELERFVKGWSGGANGESLRNRLRPG